ncbi:hypothetical protein HDU93_000272, partial [Gonapodya sp. JEL0774]
MNIPSLPPETLSQIFRMLPPKTVHSRITRVNRQWRQAAIHLDSIDGKFYLNLVIRAAGHLLLLRQVEDRQLVYDCKVEFYDSYRIFQRKREGDVEAPPWIAGTLCVRVNQDYFRLSDAEEVDLSSIHRAIAHWKIEKRRRLRNGEEAIERQTDGLRTRGITCVDDITVCLQEPFYSKSGKGMRKFRQLLFEGRGEPTSFVHPDQLAPTALAISRFGNFCRSLRPRELVMTGRDLLIWTVRN